MKKAFLLFIALLFISGCSSTFVIEGADKISEEQRVKLLINLNVTLYKTDDKYTPASSRGPGTPDEFTYFITPGKHLLFVQLITMQQDKGTTIVFRPGKKTEVKTDTRTDRV